MKTEMEVALEALDRIERHEKECGERWAEAIVELRSLKVTTEKHAARWEKLAWLVIGVMVTSCAGIIFTG
ncbi:MAG: hypothetical protein CBD88_01040 [Flavobacteriales bacterium TMED228]|nr:MAG: hypothetical protein CBD88_01040 [Flavobacteriales bacterium TMED228]|tara:strand:+ start:1370 stop:1579 length:210 start_codon:yes stop_codon:yes gene_type:complete